MENVVHAAAGLAGGVKVENIDLAEIHLWEHAGKVFTLAGGQVIDASDFVATLQQSMHEGRSDEPCSAGDQDLHRARAACSSARSFAYLQKLLKHPIVMCARPAMPSRKKMGKNTMTTIMVA